MSAANGHTAVLQAAVEAVKLGTKESIVEKSDDMSMKHMRAWGKLMKDSLNQRGSRGETPVMVACEEGSAPNCSSSGCHLYLSTCLTLQCFCAAVAPLTAPVCSATDQLTVA